MDMEEFEQDLVEESRRQRAELRRHRLDDERELVESIDRSRRLLDVLGEALQEGASLEAYAGGRLFAGAVHHLGEDLLTLLDRASNVVDIALTALGSCRMVGRSAHDAAAAGATHPASIRDCLVLLDALGVEVEVPVAADRSVNGRIVSLGTDHLVVRGGRAVGEWVVPTTGLAYVVTGGGRNGTGSAAGYLDARRELFSRS